MILPYGEWRGPIFDRGDGIFIYGTDGKKYVDLTSGFNVVNIGYNNKQILDILKTDNSFISYLPPDFKNQYILNLENILLSLFPCEYKSILRATTGTEAVDLSIQLAKHITKKEKIISFEYSYHGNSMKNRLLGNLFESESIFHENGDIVVFRHPFIYGKNSKIKEKEILKSIENYIIDNSVSCCIIEGVTTCGGTLKFSINFIEELSKILKNKCVLFIFDEVGTGFCRTGKNFSFEHFKIKPDLVCLAKGLSCGYTPIAAVVTLLELNKIDFYYYSTFAWTPLSAQISYKVLEFYKNNNLSEKVNILGPFILDYLKNKLNNCENIIDIRGLGFEITLECKNSEICNYILNKSLDEGIILSDGILKNTIMIMPPLIIKKDELVYYIDRLIEIILLFNKK